MAGTLGNVVSFLVFSRKKFKKTVFEVYYRVLSLVYIFGNSYAMFDFFSYKFNMNIQTVSLFSCKSNLYLIYLSGPLAAYILAAISVDRMINTVSPTRFLIRKNKKFQISYCFCVLIFNAFYYLPVPYYMTFTESEPFITNETTDTNDSLSSSFTIYECNLDDGGLVYW